jgi:hypothetical protein
MSLFKSRLLVSGLAVAGLAGAVALGYAAPHLGRSLLQGGAEQSTLVKSTAPADSMRVRVAEKAKDGVRVDAPGTQVETGRNVRVQAPHADVNVDKERGKVQVRAPYTDVHVDPDRGQVRVRAPYVNLDIRW